MSKGSGRRPMQISQEELDKRWEAVFNGKPAEDMFDHLMIDKILTKEVEKLVKPYTDAKVKEKFGEDYEVFDYYDTLNLSWNVEIEAISKITDYRELQSKLKLPKLKNV